MNATVIPSLPYTDSGNTCGFNDDYTAACLAGGTAAPDVVYAFTPTSNMCVNISVCLSDFDTGLYVWQTSAGNVIACNDDACGLTSQQSKLSSLQLLANTTYYIVVDAFAGCGTYEMTVAPCASSCAPLACLPGYIQENEPVCGTGYDDVTNGGCNSTPPVFQAVPVPSAICGQYGKFCYQPVFCVDPRRDTDWYEITLAAPITLRLCVQGETSTQIDVVNASASVCPNITLVANSIGFPFECETFCEDVPLAAGTYWIFVAPQAGDASAPPCGTRYVLSFSEALVGVDPSDGVSPAVRLYPIAPNPARRGAVIRYELPAAMQVTLMIHDPAGRTVRVATQASGQAGLQQWKWDGRDNSGNRVKPGVYLVSLKGKDAAQSQSVVVLE